MITRNLKEYFQLAMSEQASIIEATPKENIDVTIEKEHDRILMMAQASSDLDALKKTILYAEDTIQRLANRNLASSVCNSDVVPIKDHTPERIRILDELRTRGFGKTVVFVDSSQALRAYRVTQANESYIQGNVVVVNRLAPVAAELAPAEVGDIITLPKLGDCEVIAVSLVDRFRSGQSCNFQSLAYDDQDLKSMLTPLIDVVESLKRWRNMIVSFFEDEKLNIEEQSLIESVSLSNEHLKITATASLGAQFYTSPTKLQEQIIRRGGRGLLIVQGIAGSGKTSVALGRTKFLCDRRTQPEDDETWDNFFEPRTSVGFVLHSQLVDYLKETRDQLFISDMPIMDYNQLRQKLLLQRTGFLQVKLKKDDKGKYSRCNAQEDNCDGTILLLKIADRAIRDAYITQLKASLLLSPDWDIKELKPEHKAILRQIWETVQQQGIEFIENLARPPHNVNYTNDGLAKRIEKFRQSILSLVDQSTRWLSVPIAGRWLSPQNFREALHQLNKADYELGHGLDKNQVELLLATEEQLDQLYKIRDRLFIEGGQKKLPHNISRESLITLLQQEQLVIERDHRWAKIRHHESLFEERITTGKAWIRRKNGNDNWVQIGLISLFGDNAGSNARRRLNERLRLLLVDSLKLPDLLLTSLNLKLETYVIECSDSAKMRTTLTNMRQRLTDKKLSDSDIDLFLAITHLITDGYEGEVSALRLTDDDYFSTVFIDEVQDFTELQVFIMGAQANPKRRAVTVVGDFCQQLYPNRINQLDICFPKATKSELEPLFLNTNKRQERTVVLANFSSWFRENILKKPLILNGDVVRPIPVENSLTITEATPETCPDTICELLTDVEANHSVAVICPTEDQAMNLEQRLHDSIESLFRKSTYSSDNRDLTRPFYVHFTTPRPTKGLEFDVVVAAYFDEYKWEDPIQANAAYVAISRPRQVLHIVGSNLQSGLLSKIMS